MIAAGNLKFLEFKRDLLDKTEISRGRAGCASRRAYEGRKAGEGNPQRSAIWLATRLSGGNAAIPRRWIS